MALPKEPRQKMINLMYLVLTALLALNVSAEILNAFKTVERSLTTTNNTINQSTSTILASLQEKMTQAESAEKARIWYPKAQRAQELTKQLNSYIEGLKAQIMKEAGFDPAKNGDSTFKEDNQDVATRIMVEQGKGKELRGKLEQYKKDMLAIDDPAIPKEIIETVKSGIDGFLKQIDLSTPHTKNNANDTWEAVYFRMVPTVAATTMLTKFQNDVRTAENRTVALFHEQVGKVVVRYDNFTAIVGQSSNYIMPGQEIEIMAGVGAFSKAAAPQISIAGRGAALGEDGAAHMKLPGGGLGKHTIPVVISFKDQDGKPQTINKTIEYTVGQANASIALDKMNVLYIGVDNPITIAASGGGDDRIAANISGGGGSIRKVGAGKYIARVSSVTDNCTITVSVDGKTAGASQFRVRTIPTPVATIGNFESGSNVPAGAFKAQGGVAAWIKDFPFELKYSVSSFTISADNDEGDIDEAACTGNTWSPKAQQIIRSLKSGRLVTIDNIRAVGPDGTNRKLPSLVYYIK
jgi:gliding motility-associated protein GldM